MAAVATHRALTSDQISLLLWGEPAPSSRCRLRLRLLSQAGYLERAEQPVTLSEGRRPLVYFLDKRGASLAAEVREIATEALDWRKEHNDVRWPFLEHLLATNEIRVRLQVAAAHAGFTVLDWLDDKTLASQSIRDQFQVQTTAGRIESWAVGPDGYAAFLAPDGVTRHRVFIEADRGTVPLARWQTKVEKYLAYFRSEVFTRRYSATKPFRVLTVTTSSTRLENMKRMTEEARSGPWFWFTTYQALGQRLRLFHEPLWQMAGSTDMVAFPHPLLTPH